MRSMGDIDILYQSSQDKKIKKVMVELGYGKSLEGRKHDSYFRAPYIGVEMHRELLAVDRTNSLVRRNFYLFFCSTAFKSFFAAL